MPLFREHRGDFIDSLKTTKIVTCQNDLLKILLKDDPALIKFEIKIEPYPNEEHCFDKRCGWFTQIVTMRKGDETEFSVYGMLSEPLRC